MSDHVLRSYARYPQGMPQGIDLDGTDPAGSESEDGADPGDSP